jgi:DNA-binding transcriptional LysR family regulator
MPSCVLIAICKSIIGLFSTFTNSGINMFSMQKRMDLQAKDLDFILLLLRQETLTRAAKHLGVEQSTLSRQLQLLEERLGYRLFSRHRSGLRPTSAVQSLLPLAEQLEIVVRQANRLSLGASHEKVEVHLTCPEVIADRMLAPQLRELLAFHPQVVLKMTATDEMLDLGRLDCDLAIRIGSPPKGDIVVQKLFASELCFYAKRGFALTGRPLAISEVPIIAHDRQGGREIEAFERFAGGSVVFRSNRMTTCLIAAEGGVGALLLPRIFGKQQTGLEELTVTGWQPPLMPLFLASPRAVRKMPLVDATWRWIRTVFTAAT